MGIPQVLWLVLAGATLAISLVKHGESRGTYNFWATLISLALEFWIVWAGGFFR